MTAAAKFKQSDVTRALRGAIRAGMPVGKAFIDPITGRIEIEMANVLPAHRGNSCDDILR
ncbi:hypothetical protein [Sphingomonas sp. 1P08PE]|uniref:hypothetical protein n=1 Tax=Sphingomonas sp. 1P08PE TaxID=554122 RepID=UPI0039A06253